ncbi:MAG: prepilin-type N-terminal cleavage/methylation domain-containing protein [Deltaproteobacteria bacterium]|nr:MAG: prepilin-type N-terminal cleavage/methylation domain-containing protein [Deltaproteobacteria bacterium]
MNHKGYTLIEILIAILILGIVLSTVYASYTGTFRIIGEIQEDAEVYGMARGALDRMVRDLQSAALWRGAFTFKTKSYTLGNREFMRLIFRSTAHIAFGDKEAPDGISVIEYGVEEGKEGYTLLRIDSLYRDPEKESSPADGFLLCNRVEALTYTFYDELGKEHESWDSGTKIVEVQKKRVPAAVLIRLSVINETDRKHPHLFMTRVRLPFNRPEAP